MRVTYVPSDEQEEETHQYLKATSIAKKDRSIRPHPDDPGIQFIRKSHSGILAVIFSTDGNAHTIAPFNACGQERESCITI